MIVRLAGLLCALALGVFSGVPAAPRAAMGAELKIGMTQFPSTLNPLIDSMLAKSYVLESIRVFEERGGVVNGYLQFAARSFLYVLDELGEIDFMENLRRKTRCEIPFLPGIGRHGSKYHCPDC